MRGLRADVRALGGAGWRSASDRTLNPGEPTGVGVDDHPRGRGWKRIGVGHASAHHGELLQGVFSDGSGRLRPALVTLPLAELGSTTTFEPRWHQPGIETPPGMLKVERAAALTLYGLSHGAPPVAGGRVSVRSDVPCGIGMGSSTCDVVATVRAVADCLQVRLSQTVVARLAALAELAADSVMVQDQVVLFAHRDGVVLETLGQRLPPMVVIGCDTAPCAVVNTLDLPTTEYPADEVATFRVLRAAIRRAVRTGDVALAGGVATASARINQRFVPKPVLSELVSLCRSYGGCGVQVAHSGTVAGLIFDARDARTGRAIERCHTEIERLGLAVTAVVGGDRFGYSGLSGSAVRTR